MVMTLTRHEAGESKEMEGLRAHAEALLTLSSPAPSTTCGGGTGTQPSSGAARRAMAAAEGVFECKTCSKRFPSFQALGGHRTSHTRLQARVLGDPAAAAAERDRAARVHECAVCGLEFSMGQALGGHMRRHRGEGGPPAAHDDGPARPDRDMPDLNLPPLDDDNGKGSGSGDGQGPRQSGDGRGSAPQLLNLLV